jgi:tetratricopeptide (TPR) repeat protein
MEGSIMAEQANNSRRLSVNAAFMQDIKNDNRDLKILMDRLAVLTQPREAAANHWPELIQLLGDLNDQLALHFGLEEAYGYFDQALDADPEMSLAAENLRNQHAVLFEESRHLAEAAAHACTGDAPIEGVTPEVTTAQEKVLVRFDSFVKQFHEHEEAELKLILDALDEDLGVGD